MNYELYRIAYINARNFNHEHIPSEICGSNIQLLKILITNFITHSSGKDTYYINYSVLSQNMFETLIYLKVIWKIKL